MQYNLYLNYPLDGMTHLVLKLDFTGQNMVFESHPLSFSLKLQA